MEFHQLEQFAAIASCGTMREAANRMYLSQPTLSHNLKKLESDLGHQLFDRSHNKMELTEYGKILQRHTEHMLSDWRALLDELEAEERRQAQTIRVGCYSAVHTFFEMPQLAIAFQNINFEVWVGGIAAVCQGFREGSYDLVIVPACELSRDFGLAPIEDERAYLSVPICSALADRESLTLDDLRGRQLLVPDDIEGLSDWYRDIVRAAGVDELLVEYTDRETYLSKLDSTLKCHFSTTLMHRLTQSGSGRVEIPIEGEAAHRTVCYARNPEDDRLRPIASFLDRNNNKIYSGHAYIPYLLSHGNAANLTVHDDGTPAQ